MHFVYIDDSRDEALCGEDELAGRRPAHVWEILFSVQRTTDLTTKRSHKTAALSTELRGSARRGAPVGPRASRPGRDWRSARCGRPVNAAEMDG